MQLLLLLLLQFYNLIYVRLQNFISPLSGQPSSSFVLYNKLHERAMVNTTTHQQHQQQQHQQQQQQQQLTSYNR